MAITFNWTAAVGAYKKSTIATTVEQTLLDDQQTKGSQRGCDMFVYSSAVAGTLKVYFIDRDNVDRLIQSTPVASDSLTVIDFDYHLPRFKAAWKSDSGTSWRSQIGVRNGRSKNL